MIGSRPRTPSKQVWARATPRSHLRGELGGEGGGGCVQVCPWATSTVISGVLRSQGTCAFVFLWNATHKRVTKIYINFKSQNIPVSLAGRQQ